MIIVYIKHHGTSIVKIMIFQHFPHHSWTQILWNILELSNDSSIVQYGINIHIWLFPTNMKKMYTNMEYYLDMERSLSKLSHQWDLLWDNVNLPYWHILFNYHISNISIWWNYPIVRRLCNMLSLSIDVPLSPIIQIIRSNMYLIQVYHYIILFNYHISNISYPNYPINLPPGESIMSQLAYIPHELSHQLSHYPQYHE